jgi:TldD protein
VDQIQLKDKARFFFEHYGVTENDLEHYLAAALSAGGDYADLYFEYLSSTSLMVDESMVKSASQGISAGCGVRVVSGERTGYAYTDDLSAEGRRAQSLSCDAAFGGRGNHGESGTGDAR